MTEFTVDTSIWPAWSPPEHYLHTSRFLWTGERKLNFRARSFSIRLLIYSKILATLPAVILIDRVGRRPLLMSGAAGCLISLVTVGTLTTLYGKDWSAHGDIARIAVGM